MQPKDDGSPRKFQIGGAKANYVMAICSLLWMVNFMDRQILAVVLQPIKVDLGLTDAQAGWITTAFLLSMAVFAIPIAHWVDRGSRRKAIGVMAITWSLGTALTGLGRSFTGVMMACLATGTAQSGFSAGALALISASYPVEVRGKRLGFFNLFQLLGISAGLILGGFLSTNLGGWRTPFFFFALPGTLLGFMAFLMQDYPTKRTSTGTPRGLGLVNNIKDLLRVPTLRWFYAGYALFCATGFAFLGWIPSLIIRKFGVGEDVAGLIMAVSGVFMVPGVLLGGIWADKWEGKRSAGRMEFAAIMFLLSAICCLSAIVFVFFMHQGGLGDLSIWIVGGALLFGLYSATAAAVNPTVMAVSQTVVSPDQKSLAWGLGLSIVMLLGGAWSPMATGYLSDRLGGEVRGLTLALLAVCSLGIGGFACFWKSSLHYREDAGKAAIVGAAWD